MRVEDKHYKKRALKTKFPTSFKLYFHDTQKKNLNIKNKLELKNKRVCLLAIKKCFYSVGVICLLLLGNEPLASINLRR